MHRKSSRRLHGLQFMSPEVGRGSLFAFGALLLALLAGCGGGSSTMMPALSPITPAEVRVETAEMLLAEARSEVETERRALAEAEMETTRAVEARLATSNAREAAAGLAEHVQVIAAEQVIRRHVCEASYSCTDPASAYMLNMQSLSAVQRLSADVIKVQDVSDMAREAAMEADAAADSAQELADMARQIAGRIQGLADSIRIVLDFSEAGITGVDPETELKARVFAVDAEMAMEEAHAIAEAAWAAAAAARADADHAGTAATEAASSAEWAYQAGHELWEATRHPSSFAWAEEAFRAGGIGARIYARATDMQPDEFPHDRAITVDRLGNPAVDGFMPSTDSAPALGGGWTGGAFERALPGDGSTRYMDTVYGRVEALDGSTEYVTVYSHPDHLRFGWWLEIPDRYAGAAYKFSTFAGGEVPFPMDAVEALAGTATYEGPAAGIYVETAPDEWGGVHGEFTAAVRLTADFDANDSLGGQAAVGTISGAVTDFRANGRSLGDWVLDLMTAGLETAASNTFMGQAQGRAVGFYLDEQEHAWLIGREMGNWKGRFHGQGDSATGHPGAVAGEFNAVFFAPPPERAPLIPRDPCPDSFACIGPPGGFVRLSGAFGAHKTEPIE